MFLKRGPGEGVDGAELLVTNPGREKRPRCLELGARGAVWEIVS